MVSKKGIMFLVIISMMAAVLTGCTSKGTNPSDGDMTGPTKQAAAPAGDGTGYLSPCFLMEE